MAEYRTIHTKIWQDEWFCDLEPDAKLLFIYLFSNPAASVAGIYEKPLKFVAFECGLSVERTTELLAAFAAAGKAEYEDGIVWVRHLRKYQETTSAPVQARIQKDIDAIPDSAIKRRYLACYGTLADGNETVPVGSGDRLDSLSRADTVKDTVKDTETETESGDEKASSPAPATPRKSKRDPRTDHPAIKAVSAVTGKRPPLQVYDRIIAAVGDRPDIERMGEVFQRWRAHGYSPVNLEGWLFDWYVKGIPQQQARAPNPAQRNGTEPVGMAGLNEWRRQKGLKSGEP